MPSWSRHAGPISLATNFHACALFAGCTALVTAETCTYTACIAICNLQFAAPQNVLAWHRRVHMMRPAQACWVGTCATLRPRPSLIRCLSCVRAKLMSGRAASSTACWSAKMSCRPIGQLCRDLADWRCSLVYCTVFYCAVMHPVHCQDTLSIIGCGGEGHLCLHVFTFLMCGPLLQQREITTCWAFQFCMRTTILRVMHILLVLAFRVAATCALERQQRKVCLAVATLISKHLQSFAPVAQVTQSGSYLPLSVSPSLPPHLPLSNHRAPVQHSWSD